MPILSELMVAGAVFVLTALLAWIGVPVFKRWGLGQRVRDDGPKTHLGKSGTPTLGGVFFLIPIVIVLLLAIARVPRVWRDVAPLLGLLVAYGIVGCVDDIVKVKIDRRGLSVKQKTVALGLISVAFAVYYVVACDPFILMPFTLRRVAIVGVWKALYAIVVALYLFYLCNSVNITDGLDGLLASQTALFATAIANYTLLLPMTPAISAYRGFAWCLTAGALGFLLVNHHPAKVMMGDVGSQALGAAMAGLCLMLGIPWIVLVSGFVFVFEGLSVVIQVTYFRRTGGRRLFRMSPIHHHFELGGWKETRVVLVFAAATFVFCLLGVLTLWPFS